MKILYLILATILSTSAYADLMIHEVYYNPIEERGSEFIELYNNGSELNLANYSISTSSGAFALNGSISQQSFLLIADFEWESHKDNNSWSSADITKSLTLTNSNGHVQLKLNNNIVDTVGWGQSTIFESEPALTTPQSKSLSRKFHDTNNNAEDFLVQNPTPTSKQTRTLFLSLTVKGSSFQLIDEDPFSDGIQIYPIPGKNKILIQNLTTETNFNGNNYLINQTLSVPYYLTPGNYTLSSNSTDISFELLPLKSIHLNIHHIDMQEISAGSQNTIYGDTNLSSSKPTIWNNGNTPIELEFSFESGDIGLVSWMDEPVVLPGEMSPLNFEITIPSSVPPGSHLTTTYLMVKP